MPRFGCFTLGKEADYLFYRRVGGPQWWSGLLWKISPPLGFDPWTFYSLVSCYTDYAILVHFFLVAFFKGLMPELVQMPTLIHVY